MNNSYAVVTGASQEVRKIFAKELAKKGINLILISLPNQDLGELSKNLHKEFGVQVVFKETDLSITENMLSTSNWINDNYNVSILVNNAGIGGTKKFEDTTVSYIEKIIQLNVVATSLLTHQLLSNLKKQSKAYILNVSKPCRFITDWL
ncbi:SDR family NAD(P)-dependent oxidoreductase [Chryseobacterium indoltheticum]|uniref:SDR family NAD(P)-dependent oxidoreductase n=1 Tax=Chryseobacterium indoltheticum TaxID=254 RepID=UPI003F49A39B